MLIDGHLQSALRDLSDDHWISALPELLTDFQQLLRDTLDLLTEIGEADDRSDLSHWDLPSVSPHRQNRGFREWVILIELLRDAWLRVNNVDSGRAFRIALAWFEQPYPAFKRLAIFAATNHDRLISQKWVAWLLKDGAWWLWSIETKREVCRSLVLRGHTLTATCQELLEAAILAGPPRGMDPDSLELDDRKRMIDHSVWLRLAKLNESNLKLGKLAAARLKELSSAHPGWVLASDERDEFSHWMSGTGDPDYERTRNIETAPQDWRSLVVWLPQERSSDEHTWRDVCRNRFFPSLRALCSLARNDVWPMERWREALQTWSEDSLTERPCFYIASLIRAMPEDVLEHLVHSVSWWIEAASKSTKPDEHVLLDLCRKILTLPVVMESRTTRDGEPIYTPVFDAINHPVGHVTQALINIWFKQKPNDNDLLPPEIEQIFTSLCSVREERFRHGRVILGSHLIALFRVDRSWTERHLLPLLKWNNPVEAKAVWEGFLWSPRLYQPLLTAFKREFLESAVHYDELGEHREQLVALLTYAALGPTANYSMEEFRLAIGALPQDGLEQSAQTLAQALEGAAEQREEYWKNRVQPFWEEVWPKLRQLATERIARSLAQLAVAAGREFPAALAAVQHWLQPIEHADHVVQLVSEAHICEWFPDNVLQLLYILITRQPWRPLELDQCLTQIVQADPNLADDFRFRRLRQFGRELGG